MKTTILFTAFRPPYEFVRNRLINLVVVCTFLFPGSASSQCTNYTVNWDYLDFLHNSAGSWYNINSPSTGQPFVTNTMEQSQNFAVGPTNMLTIATTIPVTGSGGLWGDITTHTGETGAYGTGADIAFIKSGTSAVTITLTFLNEVTNVRFSVFDIDQEITFAPTATNASGTPQNITLTKPAGVASLIPLNGVAAATTVTGTAPLANWSTGGGSGTAYATNSNNGTVNVDIAGPVKTIVLTFSNDGNTNDFWLSDITACSPDPGFPSSYYYPYTQPFTNQPAYFLANPDYNLNVYMVDPVNRIADLLFTDPGIGGTALNSIAYDPVNKYVYYVMNGSGAAAGNRSLKRYNVTTNSITTVIADLNTLGVPTFTQGVEAASAAFYNGSLYLGIEGTEPSSFATNTESIIWRIDFDGSGAAVRASQVFGVQSDNGGGQPSHDWGDFITRDGTIITHASNLITPYQSTWVHFDMTTGTATNTYSGYLDTAGQLGQIYDGTVYRVDNQIGLYNNNGTTAPANPISVTSCSPSWNNRPANDASDPFKPKCDFGDAPSTYDPVALSPAANQKACNNSTLRIGSAWGDEWAKNTSADASGDGEEDGITTVTNMVADGNPYNHVQDVTVFNNTGATAYLAAWLDYNADGIFDASEGVVVTVPSSASPQTISLGWIGITVAAGTPNSFLRVRLYSGALTANDATGWLSDGETEDYPVVSSLTPLSIQLLNFNATVTADKDVWLSWKASAAKEDRGFEVQRSSDQQTWETIKWVDVNSSTHVADYSLLDAEPLEGRSYYRLEMVEQSGSSKYSSTRTIQIDQIRHRLKVFPNPAKNDVNISFNSNDNQQATLVVRSFTGEMMIKRPVSLVVGANLVEVALNGLSNGLYLVELTTADKKYINKLSITR